uniref:Uncharacterized protein n=1 Tax=Arundo donax TaxID=35708 RepID=A0A0A8YE37_ARUDO
MVRAMFYSSCSNKNVVEDRQIIRLQQMNGCIKTIEMTVQTKQVQLTTCLHLK